MTRRSLMFLVCGSLFAGAFAAEETVHRNPGKCYEIRYPEGWRRIRLDDDPKGEWELALGRLFNQVRVSAEVSPLVLEDTVDWRAYLEKLENSKLIHKKSIRVDGEPAVEALVEFTDDGNKAAVVWTFVVRQGVVYRVFGAQNWGDRDKFLNEYRAIRDTLKFRGDREEWLAKSSGKPRAAMLLGGALEFEISHPRWKENTFAEEQNHRLEEYANYELATGAAWLRLEVLRESREPYDAAAELADRTSEGLKDVTRTKRRMKVGSTEIDGWEVAGEFRGTDRRYRCAAATVDDLCVTLMMECSASLWEATEPDWERLCRTLKLRNPSDPRSPAWYPRAESIYTAPTDPVVAAIVAAGKRLTPSTDLAAPSPDGTRLAMVEGQALSILEADGSRKRFEAAAPVRRYGQDPPAWSADGKRIAYLGEKDAVVVDIASGQANTFKEFATHLWFGRSADELLLAVPVAKAHAAAFGDAPATTRLITINLNNGERRTLIEFPLSRFAAAAVSPDGRRIALACNRDRPRTHTGGTNLFLADADGGNLRPLTQGLEVISALSWSADGQWIYALRRLPADEQRLYSGPVDLIRIPAAGGAAENLTKVGTLDAARFAGGRVFVSLRSWNVPQLTGTFVLTPEKLAAAVAGLPDCSRLTSAQVADVVRPFLGGKPVSQFVPTPENLKEIADAFAKTADGAGRRMDFTIASMARLASLAGDLHSPDGTEPLVILGLGAYYGELLRRSVGARWTIKPVPFGEWFAGSQVLVDGAVEVDLPFSRAAGSLRFSEEIFIPNHPFQHRKGRPVLLVYPPAAARAMADAESKDHRDALARIDAGDVEAGLMLLEKVVRASVVDTALTERYVALCRAAGREDLARNAAVALVDAGSKSGTVLALRAQTLAATEPLKAADYHRRAMKAFNRPDRELLLEQAACLTAAGERAAAESCLRRAAMLSYDSEQKDEAIKRMGLTP